MGKKSLRYVPLFGWWYWLADHIFIDRTNRYRAQDSIEKAKNSLAKNTNILMFAEGTRNRGKNLLLPFKTGAFRMAITTGAPIKPVVLSSYVHNIDLRKPGKTGTLFFEALPPIETKGLTLDDVKMLRDKTHDLMLETLKRHNQILGTEQVDPKWQRIMQF